MPKLGTATSESHTRPHFASHTQSSLMKKRTPMKKKLSSLSTTRDANGSKRSQRSTILRLNGIHKRQNNITKQSRSMQMLIMILKQQRDRRATVFLSGNELTGTTCQLENSFVSLRSDLIRDVSHDLKKCFGSPAKLAILHGKPIKAVDDSEKRAEDLHASPQDETNCAGRENSEDIHDSSENRAIVNVACKLQLCSSDEKEPADSCHHRIEPGEKPDNFPNEDCPEIKMQVQPRDVSPNVNAATNRKRTRKLWVNRKPEARNEHVDHACRTDLHGSKNTRFTKYVDNPQGNCLANDKSVMNGDVATRKRGALQKNLPSNQRAWRPSGVPKTYITESAMSLTQPISQKSSQSTEKSTTSTKSKHSSIEHVDESASTSILANQSKMLMKENRDPRANRMTKICEHLAETKQQQRLQSGGTLPKKRWWRTKIGSKVLDKRDDAKSTLTLSKSKSRHCQTQPIMPIEPLNNPNNVDQHRNESTLIYSKRSRTLEVIHTLKKIIDSVKEDEDAKENAVKNNDFDHKKNYSEIQTSPNCDTSQNKELHMFTKDLNLDGADRSFSRSRKSISTQTELESPSYYKIDVEKNQDLKETLKLTRIVATQTSPSYSKNVVEVGCNTTPYIVGNDVEISCDLIGITNLEIEVDSTTIEDKSTSDVPIRTTKSLSVQHIEDTNENKELPLSECKKTLNTKMSLKLDNCDSVEIPAKTTNDAVRAKKIIHEKACQVSLKSSNDKTNTDIDKQESTKCSNNHGANNNSVNKLFLERSRPSFFDCDVSCSSEEVTEYLENDVQCEDLATSKLKVEGVPSGVIAAFELAAERARNLHEAVIIYHKNLMSKASEKRDEREETKVEDYETPKFGDDRHCLKKHASFINHENEDKIKSEFEAICHLANNGEDFGDFSTCSSRASSFDEICEFELPRSIADQLNFNILDREEECTLLPRSEQARSILNKRSDLKDERLKSLMQLMHRTQEGYALELLQSERNDESFETEGVKNDKTLTPSAAIKETSFISRETLLPLIYCVVCTVVFWCLQFSFRCDSMK